MSLWPRIVLFGDSITQYAMNPNGWGTHVAELVQRKCDIYNRGFSGYNTDNALQLFPKIVDEKLLQNVSIVTLFFGANDSVLTGSYSNQHVPVPRFQNNLEKLVDGFISFGVVPDKIVIIGPPPVEAELRLKAMIEKGNGDVCDRSNKKTIEYAKVCVKVANEKKCRVVDIYTEMFKQTESLAYFLHDGLHFSDEGNAFLAKLLSPHVEQLIGKLEMNLPDWKVINNVE